MYIVIIESYGDGEGRARGDRFHHIRFQSHAAAKDALEWIDKNKNVRATIIIDRPEM